MVVISFFQRRVNALDGFAWWCRSKYRHKVSVRSWSYFQNSISCYQIYSSLATSMEVSLGKFANQFEMNYSSPSVDWANFVCEPMKYWVHENMACIQMSGVVEIDESIFGRRVKYPRGNWDYMVTVLPILHSMERNIILNSTNRLIDT